MLYVPALWIAKKFVYQGALFKVWKGLIIAAQPSNYAYGIPIKERVLIKL